MALIDSINIELGIKMPNIDLKDTNGTNITTQDVMGKKGLIIYFTCNHCPYALAIWPRIIELYKYSKKLGINSIAVNPNIHPDYPADSPEEMKKKVSEWNIPFPYLIDENQETTKQYQAQCTPDIYLLNSKNELIYHGRLDDNWKKRKRCNQTRTKIGDNRFKQWKHY